MKKNNIKKVLLITMLFSKIIIYAHDFEADGIYYNIISDVEKTVEVTYKGEFCAGYIGEYIGDVVIPNEVVYNNDVYIITSIGDNAFCACGLLTSVNVSNSITNIGDYAFRGCSELINIILPENIMHIGISAFHGTGWFANQNDGILYIESYCLGYKGDKPIGVLYINDGTKLIADVAFSYCEDLTDVIMPNTILGVGYQAFYYCERLVYVAMGNSVYNIDDAAFSNCSNLTDVTIPNSIINIGAYAFSYCYNLKSIIIPNSVSEIKEGLFNGCVGLEIVTIGESVECIGVGAFQSCKNLKQITIAKAVKSIGEGAFAYCSGLLSLELGEQLNSIGENAFYNSSLIKEIKVFNPIAYSIPENVFVSEVYDNAKLIVMEGNMESYKNTASWNKFYNIVDATMGVDVVEYNKEPQISVTNKTINISRIIRNQRVLIYDILGKLLYSNFAIESELNIELNQNGTYFVKVGDRVLKVILK